MRYFFVSNSSKQYTNVLKQYKCDILCSYYDISQNNKTDFTQNELYKYPYNVFLDCGAFSAWTQGKAIGLRGYLKFIRKFEHKFERITVLDKIPETQSSVDTKLAGEESLRNYNIMKKILPLTKLVPIYHFGEDFSILEQYVKDGVDLIGLGGIAGSVKPGSKGKLDIKKSLAWFAQCFKAFPKQKFHGFGMFSRRVLHNFPFYSCDSTHWLQSGRYGHIIKFNPKKMFVEQLDSKLQKTWTLVDSLKGGYDLRDLIDTGGNLRYINRSKVAVIEINKYIEFTTRLWETRGIKW